MVEFLMDAVREKIEAGNLAGALQELNSMLATYPDAVEACWQRSLLHLRMKNFEQALNDLDQVIDKQHKVADALSQRALVRLQLQDFESAIVDCQSSKLLDSSIYQTYLYEGLAWFNLGKYPESIPCFSEVLIRMPAHQEGQRLRGMAYCLGGDYAEGLIDIQAVLAANREDEQAWFWLGFIRQQEGNTDAALAAFNESIARNGYNKSAYVSRGRIWLEKGEKRKALQDFEAAQSLDPNWDIVPALLHEARQSEGRGGIFGAWRDLQNKHKR